MRTCPDLPVDGGVGDRDRVSVLIDDARRGQTDVFDVGNRDRDTRIGQRHGDVVVVLRVLHVDLTVASRRHVQVDLCFGGEAVAPAVAVLLLHQRADLRLESQRAEREVQRGAGDDLEVFLDTAGLGDLVDDLVPVGGDHRSVVEQAVADLLGCAEPNPLVDDFLSAGARNLAQRRGDECLADGIGAVDGDHRAGLRQENQRFAQ